eukprot:s1524_g15.t1
MSRASAFLQEDVARGPRSLSPPRFFRAVESDQQHKAESPWGSVFRQTLEGGMTATARLRLDEATRLFPEAHRPPHPRKQDFCSSLRPRQALSDEHHPKRNLQRPQIGLGARNRGVLLEGPMASPSMLAGSAQPLTQTTLQHRGGPCVVQGLQTAGSGQVLVLAFHVVVFSVIRATVSLKPSAVGSGEHDAKTTLHGTSSLRSSEEQVAHQYYMATGRFPPWFLRQDGVEEPVFRYLGQALNESVVTIRQADGHMHVVYALEATSNVLNAALVSMVTLGRHMKEPHLLTIHVIGENVEVIEKELVACFFNFMGDQAAPHVELHELHALPYVMLQFAHRTLPPQGQAQLDMDGFMRRTKLQMSRFYLHQYLPASASRALWLDAETLVVADIMPLRRLKMKTAVAAVEDGTGLEDETAFLRQASANFSQAQSFIPAPGAKHFKTSVLLVDLREWRRRQLHTELEALAALVHDHRTVDRLLLNLGLHSQFDMLDERWTPYCTTSFMVPCSAFEPQFQKSQGMLSASFLRRVQPTSWKLHRPSLRPGTNSSIANGLHKVSESVLTLYSAIFLSCSELVSECYDGVKGWSLARIVHCELSQPDGRKKLPKGLWRLYNECGRCISGQLMPAVPRAASTASAIEIGAAGHIIRAER